MASPTSDHTVSATNAEPDSSQDPRPCISILSLGDMGSGVASLLLSHGYVVSTSLLGRSSHTKARAEALGVQTFTSDLELVRQTDILISIVPPRDALATAQRVRKAWDDTGGARTRKHDDKAPLWYLDLNAVAPKTAREIAGVFGGSKSGSGIGIASGSSTEGPPAGKDTTNAETNSHQTPSDTDIIFVNGGIIGGPPVLDKNTSTWNKPSIPTSGLHALSAYPIHGSHLSSILSIRHISPHIGSASGLKMCFASLSKGFAALALQSYSTAQALGVLPELQRELAERVPAVKDRADRGITGCPPKAYRWVEEMREIGRCFGEDGGWENTSDSTSADETGAGSTSANVFEHIAEVFDFMADQTVLGQERIGARQRGTTAEDVAGILADALKEKRKG